MTKKPITFSQQFNIDKAKLSEIAVFDPILNLDTKIFVDPMLLRDSSSEIMREAFNGYNSFLLILWYL